MKNTIFFLNSVKYLHVHLKYIQTPKFKTKLHSIILQYTVWMIKILLPLWLYKETKLKLRDFAVFQIFRESNFGKFWVPKTYIFTFLAVLNVDFGNFFPILKSWNQLKPKLGTYTNIKIAVFWVWIYQNCFHVKLIGRKTFPIFFFSILIFAKVK